MVYVYNDEHWLVRGKLCSLTVYVQWILMSLMGDQLSLMNLSDGSQRWRT